MKKIVTFTLLTLWLCGSILAQMPLPCLRYENSNITSLQSFNGSKSTECLQIDMYAAPVHLNDNNVREYTVGEGHIEPGFSYTPTSPTAGLNITLGTNSEMQGAWFEPINYFPQLYEKIEWGVKLPDAVEQAIDNWISNDHNGTNLQPAINPFDPEQIDVKAIVEYYDNGVYTSQPVFGFFYRSFEWIYDDHNPDNLPDMDDPDNWYRKEINTPFRFRFRWSSNVIAHHSVRLIVNVPNMGYWELEPFEFDSYWGHPSKSFITTTPNGKYFATADGNVYFPVGQNLFPQQCGCIKEFLVNRDFANGDTQICSECYPLGDEDPCCGLDSFPSNEGPPNDWRGAFWRGERSTIELGTEHMAAYMKQLKYMELLAQAGGNSFRTMINAISYEFEFEKLNNYYDRSFMNWELDNLIEKAHELKLRIEFNMQLHGTFEHSDRKRWDWSTLDTQDPTADQIHSGFCYYTQSDLTGCTLEPASFFASENAKKYYKKKLRYFIARYGYSPNIFQIELISEINNVGNRENAEYIASQLGEQLSYENTATVRRDIGDWQIEMANYIKNSLQHRRHLIAANYAGQPMWSSYNTNGSSFSYEEASTACNDENFDRTWSDPAIDVIAFSSYHQELTAFQYMADPTNQQFEWNSMKCGHLSTFPDLVNVPYALVNKPAVHAETGGYLFMDMDNTFFERNIWANGFAGFASSGMDWGREWSDPRWNIFSKVRQFFNNEVFSYTDLTTENVWRPGYAEANSGQHGPNVAHWSEAVYMHRITQNQEVAVGILMNRTWNPVSTLQPDNTWDSGETNDYIQLHSEYVNANGQSCASFVTLPFIYPDAPKLTNMGNCNHFNITYYDPHTLAVIHTASESTGLLSNKLVLNEFPVLTLQRPYVLFKAVRDGNCIFHMPMNDDEYPENTAKETSELISAANEALQIVPLVQSESHSCDVFPNPFSSTFQLRCTERTISILLYNSLSERIDLSNDGQNTYNLENLPAGIYLLKVQFTNTTFTYRVIKT